MGYTQWLLVQQSDLTFRFVSDRRYATFHAGRGALQQVQPGEVRTVEVVLHLERRIPREVIHVEHRRFPVLASGLRDPASIEWEMTLIRDIVGMTSSTRPESARRRWAKRQIGQAFRWIPTAREARAIADMVSRRAKEPLLGGRVLHLVDELGHADRRTDSCVRTLRAQSSLTHSGRTCHAWRSSQTPAE